MEDKIMANVDGKVVGINFGTETALILTKDKQIKIMKYESVTIKFKQ